MKDVGKRPYSVLGERKDSKNELPKKLPFLWVFFFFGLVGPLLEITNKFIMSYKTFHF